MNKWTAVYFNNTLCSDNQNISLFFLFSSFWYSNPYLWKCPKVMKIRHRIEQLQWYGRATANERYREDDKTSQFLSGTEDLPHKVLEDRRRLDESKQSKRLEVREVVPFIEELDAVQRAPDAQDQLKLENPAANEVSESVTQDLYDALDVEEDGEADFEQVEVVFPGHVGLIVTVHEHGVSDGVEDDEDDDEALEVHAAEHLEKERVGKQNLYKVVLLLLFQYESDFVGFLKQLIALQNRKE